MLCTACGTANREGRRFCAQCAAPLSEDCPHCGFRNDPNEKFCGGCGKPTGLTSADPAAPALTPAPKPDAAPAADAHEANAVADRRQLTVVFCDLVGSTALSERLDPEELREVIRAYQQAAAEVIFRYQGHIAQYLGDGLLVFFGFPQAYEDNAQRAVRAALGIIDAIRQLKLPVANAGELRLSVRLGIQSGAVVVGGSGGVASAEVYGETPNIAARLQSLADPDMVVVGETTFRAIEGLFICDDLGPQQLKGISQPMRVYRVLGESGMQSNFEARAVRGLVSLVGREEEVGLLFKRWRQAIEGEGQTILLSGEAGVGKSRVLSEFRDRVKDEVRNRVLYYCSPYHRDTPYFPVIEQLERALRFAKDDTSAHKLAKLEAQLNELSLPLVQLVPVLASLFALPTGTRYPSVAASGEDRKKRTLHALLAIFEAMARRDPMLMVVEDLQWVDASTMEMLKLLTEWQANKPILLIITHRPEFEPSWSTFAHTVSVKLSRLGRRESTELVTRVTGGKALPDEVLQHILERTDGIPLFVEELTKTVLESNWLKDAGDHYVLSGPLPARAIPASLQDSLMARLDRLAPVKELAQLAATLGRRFTQELLAAVSHLALADIDDALSQLINAELVYRRGLAPEVMYEFKHALVQDAAYNSLLRSKRQQLHVEIARILEEQFPDAVEAKPELMSHHYRSAGLPERAIPYSLLAGDTAAGRYAPTEASAHYQAALAMAESLPPSNDASRVRIQCILKLASVASRREQFERDLENLEQARALAESIDSQEQLCRTLYWIGRTNYVIGRFDLGVEYAQQSLRVAEALGNDDKLSADPVNLLARIHCLRGEPAKAIEYAARSVGQMHRLDNQTEEAAVSGVLAFAYGVHGRYHEAIAAAEHGVQMAQKIEHLPTLAACYMFRAVVTGWFGKLESSVADFEHALTISERTGDVFRRYLAHGWRGEAYLLSDDFAAAEPELEQCIALGNQLGTSFHRGAFQAFVASIKLHNGNLDEAQGAAEEALRIARETSQPWSHSIALRVHAEILLAAAPPRLAEAEEAVRTAIGIQEQRECRCDLAWSRIALGRVLNAKGEIDGAKASLVLAHRDFEVLGIARGIEKVSSALAAMQPYTAPLAAEKTRATEF